MARELKTQSVPRKDLSTNIRGVLDGVFAEYIRSSTILINSSAVAGAALQVKTPTLKMVGHIFFHIFPPKNSTTRGDLSEGRRLLKDSEPSLSAEPFLDLCVLLPVCQPRLSDLLVKPVFCQSYAHTLKTRSVV